VESSPLSVLNRLKSNNSHGNESSKIPQSQGCIEQGKCPLKEALVVWVSQNAGKSGAEIWAFVVNGQLNGRHS
jgi:hypothetical protein